MSKTLTSKLSKAEIELLQNLVRSYRSSDTPLSSEEDDKCIVVEAKLALMKPRTRKPTPS